ncbi:MAG: acyl-phosphate glycerol 3-phosphate acyltransferase [Candidatus Omnitrophica bacterium 4484_49]|nr:MAG: acyl-phosphate glycerol 3-phosphate acyltransferase [Candidatus Omnitrophica bacterium 4484_49]
MKLLVVSLYSYFLGAIPFGYLIPRYRYRMDVRTKGSGNVGATNVLRVVGVLPGIIVLVLDALKGYISVKLTQAFSPQYIYLSGLMAIIGHCWPVYLKFKGGKGVATTIGVLLGLNFMYFIYLIVIFLIVFAFTRIVSLSSLISVLSFPLIVYSRGKDVEAVPMLVLYTVIIIYRHRENIKRLLQGEEKRISFSKKQ